MNQELKDRRKWKRKGNRKIMELDQEIESEATPPLQETQSSGNTIISSRNATGSKLPDARVSKTGKVQELVKPKGPKSSDPIRGTQGRSRFDVSRILDRTLGSLGPDGKGFGIQYAKVSLTI